MTSAPVSYTHLHECADQYPGLCFTQVHIGPVVLENIVHARNAFYVLLGGLRITHRPFCEIPLGNAFLEDFCDSAVPLIRTDALVQPFNDIPWAFENLEKRPFMEQQYARDAELRVRGTGLCQQ